MPSIEFPNIKIYKNNLSFLPSTPGVYIFKDKNKEIIYVGKAVRLRDRVSSYFQKGLLGPRTTRMVQEIIHLSFITVTSELDALLLEAHLIKKYQPYFNVREKDDKKRLYVKITISDEFPRVFLTREIMPDENIYFGPFFSTKTIKHALRLMRSTFPFDTQKVIGKKPCFWSHIGLCDPCPSYILYLPADLRKREYLRYKRNIRMLVNVLSRKTEAVRNELIRMMNKRANDQRFEEAAQLKSQLEKLDMVTRPYENIAEYLKNPNLADEIQNREISALREELSCYLALPPYLNKIECFDASHTALEKPVVGMSVLVDGSVEKQLYRKFRIKTNARDDLSFLEEALRRRFKHTEWSNPDLLVIDGGKLQVKRAYVVLSEMGMSQKIPLIGLVKPYDYIVARINCEYNTIRLKSRGALSVLQRVRDEAHRFSRAYHTFLRHKSRFTSGKVNSVS